MSVWTVTKVPSHDIGVALGEAAAARFGVSSTLWGFSVRTDATGTVVLWDAPPGLAGYTFERVRDFAHGYLAALAAVTVASASDSTEAAGAS